MRAKPKPVNAPPPRPRRIEIRLVRQLRGDPDRQWRATCSVPPSLGHAAGICGAGTAEGAWAEGEGKSAAHALYSLQRAIGAAYMDVTAWTTEADDA